MNILSNVKLLHFERIDMSVTLSPGLKKVLGTKVKKLSRIEIMNRLIERLHFLKLHNILTHKNYRIPPQWQLLLKTDNDFADESDLLTIIAKNTN